MSVVYPVKLESGTGLIIKVPRTSSSDVALVLLMACNILFLMTLVSLVSFGNKVPATLTIEPYYSLEVSDLMNWNSLVSVDPIVICKSSG